MEAIEAYNVVFRGVEGLEEAGRAPAVAENNQVLLRSIMTKLLSRVTVLVGAVPHVASGG